MTRKRIIQIVIIVVVLCVAVGVAIRTAMVRQEEQQMEEVKQMEQIQKQREEAERMEQIQKDFDELVAFASEYQESIEKLSVTSVEQMIKVMDIYEFDCEKAYKEADIGDEEQVIKEQFYMNISEMMQSIENEKEYPMLCPEVTYIYRGSGTSDAEMYLIYFYSDTPKDTWNYVGADNAFDGYKQISDNLYAVWLIPRYT